MTMYLYTQYHLGFYAERTHEPRVSEWGRERKKTHIINDCSKKSEKYEFNLIASKALFVHKRNQKNTRRKRYVEYDYVLYL